MTLRIRNVHVCHTGPGAGCLYDVVCDEGVVGSILPASQEGDAARDGDDGAIDGCGGILIPSLCHSHIHLDKCHIIEKGPPLVTGDFAEALELTARVKAKFKDDVDDLYARGSRLIRESVECGVASMRAHVEIDQFVGAACVQIGLRLKKDWADSCDVQIALFMQEPIFASAEARTPGENMDYLETVLKTQQGFDAIGSAPYVEKTEYQAKWNIDYVIHKAMEHHLHLDFHLDYNLSPDSVPLIYYVIERLHGMQWLQKMPGKSITIGHATRLSLFSPAEWLDLRRRIGELPIWFIGLPQSDIYMMGRSSPWARATLRVPHLVKEYGLKVAMAVNNVGNAFTPHGNADPLSLCPLGVAVFQAGSEELCRVLLESVTFGSRQAIGDDGAPTGLVPRVGDPADFVVLYDNASVVSAVLSPSFTRTTVKAGKPVAWRKSSHFSLHPDVQRLAR